MWEVVARNKSNPIFRPFSPFVTASSRGGGSIIGTFRSPWNLFFQWTVLPSTSVLRLQEEISLFSSGMDVSCTVGRHPSPPASFSPTVMKLCARFTG